MSETLYPKLTRQIAETRRQATPAAEDAFRAFGQAVYAEGALSAKMKQIIAVAAAHVTQCPYCIDIHTKQALRQGASREELLEALGVAVGLNAGAALVYSSRILEAYDTLGK